MYLPKYIVLMIGVQLFGVWEGSGHQRIGRENSGETSFPGDESVEKILQLTYNCEFDQAQDLLVQAIAKEPLSLHWRFFRAMFRWRKLNALGRNAELDKQFEGDMKEVIDNGEKILSLTPRDTMAMFCTGAAYGYLARFRAANGQMLDAVSLGKKGLKYHEELISISPGWYDPYLSLGLFNFYASDVSWYLKPILFLLGSSGSEEKALEYLTLVAGKGVLAKYEARETLGDLYARRHEYASAESVFVDLTKRFPRNMLYHQKATLMLFEMKQFLETVEIGLKGIELSNSLAFVPSSLDTVRIGLLYVTVGAAYTELQQGEKAAQVYREFIERNVAPRFHSFAYLSLGSLYEKQGKILQARVCYEEVVKLNEVGSHMKEANARLKELSEKPR